MIQMLRSENRLIQRAALCVALVALVSAGCARLGSDDSSARQEPIDPVLTPALRVPGPPPINWANPTPCGIEVDDPDDGESYLNFSALESRIPDPVRILVDGDCVPLQQRHIV
ncbi:MAG: hypothetical protein WD770_07105, partial [Actinomycetota bacterium]